MLCYAVTLQVPAALTELLTSCYLSYCSGMACSKQAGLDSPGNSQQQYTFKWRARGKEHCLFTHNCNLSFILFSVIASFQNQKLLSNEAMKQFESAAALRIKTCASQRQIGERKRMKDESTEKQFNWKRETCKTVILFNTEIGLSQKSTLWESMSWCFLRLSMPRNQAHLSH